MAPERQPLHPQSTAEPRICSVHLVGGGICRAPTYWCSPCSSYNSPADCSRLGASMRQDLGEGSTGAPGGTQETESRTPACGDAQASRSRRGPQKKAPVDLLCRGGLRRRGARRDCRRYRSARAAVFACGVVPLHGDIMGGEDLVFRSGVPPFAPQSLPRAGTSLPRIGR